jgi:hypothetical protein
MHRRVAALVALAITGLTALSLPVILATPAGAGIPAEDTDYRRITFPVQGKTSYSDDWGAPRAGGRTHQGNDVMGTKLLHEVAVRDGRVTSLKVDSGISGNMLTLTDDDGWFYYYIHINNDTPGTDDGANPPEYRFAPGIAVGSRVKAGDFLAFMGDSGDAEGTSPHLHFEVHRPDGTAIDPWPSLRLAQGLTANGRCRYDDTPRVVKDAASAPGYYALGADGGVFSFGNAPFHGSTGSMRLNEPIMTMGSTPSGDGYWLAASDGGIFSFGDAAFYGSTGAIKLNQPIVGMTPTKTGQGYWLVARDGGIFSFGDAAFFGSTGGTKLNQPIVGMAPTATGLGYWLVARDGGIFSFGDAAFFGSTGAMKLNQPIVAMASSRKSDGYWLLAGDGGIFSFGNAPFYGSLLGTGLCTLPSATAIVPSETGKGYWIEGADGSTWAMGDTRWMGAANALPTPPNAPVISLAVAHSRPSPT